MKFRKAYIEITNVCNAGCSFCPKTTRQPRFMDRALFSAALAGLKGRANRLFFHVMGEPLLHPDLSTYLDECASFGLQVVLVTNGLLLMKRLDDLIGKPALRQVSVSVHGRFADFTDIDLQTYFDGLQAFHRALTSPRLIMQLRLWNKRAIDPTVQTRIFRCLETTFAIGFSLEERLATQRAVMLGKNLSIDSVAPFEWPSLKNNDYGPHGTCYGLRRQCAVLADGTVTPCCLDNNGTLNLGTIGERSLTDILSGQRAVAIREGFQRGEAVEELCRKCSYRLRFSPQNAPPAIGAPSLRNAAPQHRK